MAWNQWCRKAQEQIVNVVALFGPHFKNVPKSGRADQPQRRALAFDHRIGDQGGAMDDLVHIAQGNLPHRHQLLQAEQGGLGGVVRRGQAFVQGDMALAQVVQDEVGESSTDVKPDAPATSWVCSGGHSVFLMRFFCSCRNSSMALPRSRLSMADMGKVMHRLRR